MKFTIYNVSETILGNIQCQCDFKLSVEIHVVSMKFVFRANPKKLHTINGKLQAFCAQNQEIKHWAQKVS